MQRIVSRPVPRGLALIPAFFLVVAIGCGDGSGLPKRYAVKGTVTYKGQLVEKGAVTFAPSDLNVGHTATGTIENGSYMLSTTGNNDGAVPGDYKVTIQATEVDLSAAQANSGGGSFRQDDVAKANADAKQLIPTKYSLADTSKLTFKVEAKSNRADFDLTD